MFAKGYTGAFCETLVEVCQSSPCFNGGICVQNGHKFNCTCPSSKFKYENNNNVEFISPLDKIHLLFKI